MVAFFGELTFEGDVFVAHEASEGERGGCGGGL